MLASLGLGLAGWQFRAWVLPLAKWSGDIASGSELQFICRLRPLPRPHSTGPRSVAALVRASMNDRSIGLVLCAAATVAFAYYTVWALVTPFIDAGHPVLEWFPDRRYAVLLPAALGALLVACVCVFLGTVMAVHLVNHGPKSKIA